jgi:hypothetical protein
MSKLRKIAGIFSLATIATVAVGTITSNAIVTPPNSFIDVDPSYIYAPEIQYMKDEGISYGFNNGTEYRPNIDIQRQTLVTLIVKAKYSTNEIDNCIKDNDYEGKDLFKDVPSTHHFAPFICMAKVKQIAVGYSTGEFGDTRPTKAHEAIKMIMRTLDEDLTLPMNAPLGDYTKRIYDLGFYPPTINKQNESNHETTRGEIAYIIQIIRDGYIPLSTEPSTSLLSYTGGDYTIYYPNFYEEVIEDGMEKFYQPPNATSDDNGIGLMIENDFTWGTTFSQGECQVLANSMIEETSGVLTQAKVVDHGRLKECYIDYSMSGGFTIIQRWISDSQEGNNHLFMIGYDQSSSDNEIDLLINAVKASRVNL